MDLSYLELEGQGQGIIMEVTRPLLLGQFYQVKWPITPNKSAGSVLVVEIYRNQKSRIAGLVLEFEMWRHFDTKKETKIVYFVSLCLIVIDRMVYPDPKFLIFITKKGLIFFLRLEAVLLGKMANHTKQICRQCNAEIV